MPTSNRLEAGGLKLEAWLKVVHLFELRASSLLLKPISALADGLMLVFKNSC
jgi:hypothetical protein